MAKLIIHIGFHKTGSTSLQYSLKNASKELAEENYSFLRGNESGNSSDYISVNANRSNITVKITEKFYKILKDNDGKNAIISAEHLSFIEDEAEIEQLYNQCVSLFDEVNIIAYIRRQDKLAISFKQQAAKQPHKGASPSSTLCGHSIFSPLPSLTWTLRCYLDYKKKFMLWEKVFGKNNLTVRVYDKEYLIDECICKDFSELIGLKNKLPSVNVNEGLGVVKTLLKHLLIETKAPIAICSYIDSLKINDADYELRDENIDSSSFMRNFIESNLSLNLNEEILNSLNTDILITFKHPKKRVQHILSDILLKSSNLNSEIVSSYLNILR